MKLGNLIDLHSVDLFTGSRDVKQFADAAPMGFVDNAGVVLARQLTAIDPTVFEKKYPELVFLNGGIQIDNSGGYAERIQSLRLQGLGGFTNSGDPSGNKGRISLAGEDEFLRVIEREADSVWTETQIKQSQLQNVNLPQRYLETHNMIYQREVDLIGLVGVSGGPSTGLLNTAAFTSTGAGGLISTLTAQQMYDAYADGLTTQRNGVNNTPEYSATRVITPTRCLNILQKTILNTAAGSSSVLKALQDNFPGVEFLGSPRADTQANGGNLPSASATVFYSNNGEAMKMRIPQPLTIGEIIKVGSFDFKVDSKYRIAGLDVFESTAGYILTGL